MLIRRLSLMLLMGITGCAAGPGEGPLLPRDGLNQAQAAVMAESVDRLVRMGGRSLASGDYPTAATLLEEALARDGSHREAALLLGHAHLAAGRPQDAGMAFGRVLRHSPTDRDAGIGYAKAMIAIGRHEAALEHLRSIAIRHPRDSEALNLQGVALDLLGEHDKAITVYREGLAAAPGSPDLTSNLGLSLGLSGRHQEAIAILRPLAEGYASSARHRQNFALALGLAGDFAAAERWSRMDLSEVEVTNNLRYFQALRGLAPGAVRSAALQPDVARPAVRPAGDSVQLKAAAPPVPPKPATPAAPQGRAEPAVQPASGSPAAAAAPPPERPAAGLDIEILEVGHWFVDLGSLSPAQWRELRQTHAADTNGLRRLSAGSDAGAPSLVGPFGTTETAAAFCRRLGKVDRCSPIRL